MFTLSGSGMDLNAVERDTTAPHASLPGHLGRPAGFAIHRDPQGRFELRYPQAWELEGGEAVLVRSKSTAAFARVDVGRSPQEALARLGGGLTLRAEHDGRVRGTLDLNGARFDLLSCIYRRGEETIVLTTGTTATSPALQNYAAQVLAAIRREFRVL
jgi:hypothetical protein